MGIVMAMVNSPQGLDLRALTTTRATTAIRMIMMKSTPNSAVHPPTSLISSLAIWPSDRPSRRSEQKSVTKSCTHPPSTPPITIQSVPGR